MKHRHKPKTRHHHRKRPQAKPRRHRLHRPPGRRPGGGTGPLLSAAMVDRLFWRAGFGPSERDRATWTGKPVADAVNWMLSTPAAARRRAGHTTTASPLDPTGNDTDLVLSWVDVMVQGDQPVRRAHDLLLAPALGQLA